MIEIEPIEDEDNFAFSTIVTYPRKTQISHGMYTNKVDMMNMITMIKTNIVHKDKIKGVCNVVGGRTEWDFFNDKPEFHRFMEYIFKKNYRANPFFTENKWNPHEFKVDAWGNELKKGHYVKLHQHLYTHIILYLTEGNPLIIPELKITIKPKIGSYYIFEPYILHNVPEVTDDKARYNMIINMREK
jgi:hypothetical protein